jgi:hypothetical protein
MMDIGRVLDLQGHREEQRAATESKRKLKKKNSKPGLIWERPIGGAYRKRERGEARKTTPPATTVCSGEEEETTRRWALHFLLCPLLFSHISRSGPRLASLGYFRAGPGGYSGSARPQAQPGRARRTRTTATRSTRYES